MDVQSDVKSATLDPETIQDNYSQNQQENHRKRIIIILLIILLLLGLLIISVNFFKSSKEKALQQDSDQISMIERGDNQNSIPRESQPTSSIQTVTNSPTNDMHISFSGPTQVKTNQNFILKLELDPRAKEISGIELRIEYPKDMFEVISFKALDAMPIILKGPTLNPGSIEVDLGTSPVQQKTTHQYIGEITIKALKPGTSSFKISENTRGAALTYRDYIKVVTDPISITSY